MNNQKQQKELVSIIVPVFNDESTIEASIDSIVKQTYSYTEIIIVDDGSTDQTAEICDKMSDKYKNIYIYHVKNKGVAEARNYGLYRANGTYIQFVDANDTIKPEMTSILVRQIQKSKADMIVCGYWKKLSFLTVSSPYFDVPRTYSNKEYLRCIMRDPGHHYYGVVWNKLYRKNIMDKFHILFQKGVTLGEDFIFNLQYLQHIRKVQVIQKHLYMYDCTSEKSLSRERNKTLDTCMMELCNRSKIYDVYQNTFAALGLSNKYKKKIPVYWEMFYLRNIDALKHEFEDWSDTEREKWYQTMIQVESIDEYLSNSSSVCQELQLVLLCIKRCIKSVRYKVWLRKGK